MIVGLLASAGCRQDPEALINKFSGQISPGMTRDDVEAKLGSLGRREYLGEEETRSFSLPGWSPSQRRDQVVSRHKRHPRYLNPPDILETFPLEDGAAVLVHYAFARDFRFAVGCDFLGLTLFYDGKTQRLIGIFVYDGIIWSHPDFDMACRRLSKKEALWFDRE